MYSTTINDHECVITFFNISPTSDLSELRISRLIPTACFILFSICDQRSFEKIKYFQDSIDLVSATESTSIPIIILANKTDFEQDRVVTEQSIEKLKSNFDHIIIETSVKTSQGIHEALETAIKLLQTDFVGSKKSKHSHKCIII